MFALCIKILDAAAIPCLPYRMQKNDAYQSLAARSREIALLHSSASILGWDQETHLPERAGDYRAGQLSHLSSLAHSRWVDDQVGDWLAACEDQQPQAGSIEAGNIREWRRSYDRARKLPQKLVEDLARETSLSQQAWVKARAAQDFKQFAPNLETVIKLVREVAEHVGYDHLPYDALLDEYEPQQKTAATAKLFDQLAPQLTELAIQGEELSASMPNYLPEGPYPPHNQEAFNREVAIAFGFDVARGRIDTTAHPFCTTLGPHDIRLTTRYDEADFTNSLYCVVHETGHGLYEQGLDPEHFGTPQGSAASLGIHESQSRLWENQIARTTEFWQQWLPRAASYFPQLASITPEQLTSHVNRCRRSFIRVDADELTYDLHVILRFRIESAIINDNLPVAEIPGLWNATFKEMFDLDVPNDALGCLQDVHWSHGSFGYFPTYTLGNLNAAQLMAAAHEALPGLDRQLATADYAPLLNWLRQSIHQHGQRYTPTDLIQRATGSVTAPQAHIARLKGKLAQLSSD